MKSGPRLAAGWSRTGTLVKVVKWGGFNFERARVGRQGWAGRDDAAAAPLLPAVPAPLKPEGRAPEPPRPALQSSARGASAIPQQCRARPLPKAGTGWGRAGVAGGSVPTPLEQGHRKPPGYSRTAESHVQYRNQSLFFSR